MPHDRKDEHDDLKSSKLTNLNFSHQEVQKERFQLAPTPMPNNEENLHVFSFQPTPMPKRFKFRPSVKSRDFKLPKEAFTDTASNEIDNFSPKFVVTPDMKENFAIVKVKNHNQIEDETTKSTVSPKALTTPSSTASDKVINISTSSLPPRDRVRSLLSKNPLRKRGRFVKKIKSPKSALKAKLVDGGKNKTRRRLQFIRRVTLMPKILNQQKGRNAESLTVPKEEDNLLADATNAIDAGNSLLRINSDAKKNEVEADAKVAELANNILELKAKLEQLKMELQV